MVRRKSRRRKSIRFYIQICSAVESYIAKGRDGIAEGITGEGFLLENAKSKSMKNVFVFVRLSSNFRFRKDFHVNAARGTTSQENRITLAAARYASEEAAALVHYAIALIEYTKLCQPLHLAKQKVEKIALRYSRSRTQTNGKRKRSKKIFFIRLDSFSIDRFRRFNV